MPNAIELVPAKPMERTTIVNCKYQGTPDALNGTVVVTLAPIVMFVAAVADVPILGVIVSVPDVLVDHIPPALA